MLKLIHASKIYAKNGICALNAVDLTVQDGDYISVTGASGSGKSTLMHILGLLDSLTDGEYLLDGAAVAHLPAKQRARLRSEKIGFVFQQFRLLTGMTALENVALPLALQGVPRDERSERALAVLERVGLSDRANHRPHQLSGGQQQRVALARILASKPDLLLLDEPFSALDATLRWEMEQVVRRTIRDFNGTAVLVTHDRDEVYRLSDRVAVYKSGHIDRYEEKWALFAHPGTATAARLTGCKNISPAHREGDDIVAEDWQLRFRVPGEENWPFIGIRAHRFELCGEGAENSFPYEVVERIEDTFSFIFRIRRRGAEGAKTLRWEADKDIGRDLPDTGWVCLPQDEILLLK